MENNNDRIDRFFRERLFNFEKKPDPQVWEKINSRLGPDNHLKFIYLFIRIAAGMALLLSLATGYYLVNRHTDTPSLAAKPANNETAVPVMKQTGQPVPETRERRKTGIPDYVRPAGKAYTKTENMPASTGNEKTDYSLSALQTSANSDFTGQPGREISIPGAISNNRMTLLPVSLPSKLENEPLFKGAGPGQETTGLYAEGDFPADDMNTESHHSWILGGELAPLYSYRTISSDKQNSSLVNSMNKSESGIVAYAGGIRIAYAAGRRLSVQSGVYYSRYGQEKNNVEEFTTDLKVGSTSFKEDTYLSISNSTGTISSGNGDNLGYTRVISDSRDTKGISNAVFASLNAPNLLPVVGNELSATQYFDYLEVPLTVKYKLINRKFGFSLIGGFVTNFLVNNSINLNINGSSKEIGKTSDINKVNYLASAGLGLDYAILKNVAFSLEPRFRYYINPIDQARDNVNPYSVHPYSFGIFAGLSYLF